MSGNLRNDRIVMNRHKFFLTAFMLIAVGCGSVSEVEMPKVAKIVFTVEGENGTNIFVMDPDGSNKLRLTDMSFRLRQPLWSPDGSKILYSANRDKCIFSCADCQIFGIIRGQDLCL